MQQAQFQVAAARSELQVALQQLQRLEEQLQDSSAVVENTNSTVSSTKWLVLHTHTAGPPATWHHRFRPPNISNTNGSVSCVLSQ